MIATFGAVLLIAAAAGIAQAAPGQLGFLQSRTDEVDAYGIDGPVAVAVSPDGRNVYVAGFFDDALAVFGRDPHNGALSWVEEETANGNLAGAEGVAVSPDGRAVYATGFTSDTLVALARDPGTGALDPVDFEEDAVNGIDGLDQADSVALSPNGRNVYVTALIDDSLASFSRDPQTGTLAFLGIQRDGEKGVDGLDRPENVALSPDGHNVYVTSDGDDAVAVFSRNPGTGLLSFVGAKKDGVNGVDGLDDAFGVATAPDGRHVYATSYGDNAIAAFSRDPDGGGLSFIGASMDGSGGVDGLRGSHAVTVSPDGRHVYATGHGDAALAAFNRNPDTGRLSPVDLEAMGTGGVDGAPDYGLAISSDARNLYATAFDQDKLLVFSREIATTCRGLRPTVWGTDFGDTVRGTPDADVIATLGGADTVLGLGGADIICGAGGKDRLRGGNGRDRLLGGGGRDVLRGGKGRDVLRGGKGRDRLRGGPGRDRLRGGPGRDSERE
ncbi:MAG: beta-propeller fold lactonase family protein [Actinomycetota bacterium]